VASSIKKIGSTFVEPSKTFQIRVIFDVAGDKPSNNVLEKQCTITLKTAEYSE